MNTLGNILMIFLVVHECVSCYESLLLQQWGKRICIKGEFGISFRVSLVQLFVKVHIEKVEF